MTREHAFFFFKQKTAYEIRNCDWSSDVCSSDPQIPHSENPPHQNFPALNNAPIHRNSLNYQNSPTSYNSSIPQLTHTAKPPHRKSPTPKLSLREYPTLLPAHAANLSCDNPPTHFATYPNRTHPYSVNPT